MDWQAVAAVAAAGMLFLTVIGGFYAIKGDTRVLKQRLDAVDRQLEKMDNVLVLLAENKGRMDAIELRASMSGGRLDELTNRFNRYFDDQPHERD